MTSIDRPTLLRPPEPDKNKAPIENVLEVTELKALGPVSCHNHRARKGTGGHFVPSG